MTGDAGKVLHFATRLHYAAGEKSLSAQVG